MVPVTDQRPRYGASDGEHNLLPENPIFSGLVRLIESLRLRASAWCRLSGQILRRTNVGWHRS